MARIEKVTYSLTDDIDGAELGEVTDANNPFARVLVLGDADNGFRVFDLDLSDDNAAKMEAAKTQAANNINAAREEAARIVAEAERIAAELLEPFTAAGRLRKSEPVAKPGKRTPGKKASPAAEKEMRALIRQWADRHVNEFPKQGRIPAEVIEAYENGQDLGALREWAHRNQKGMRQVSAPAALFTAPAAPAIPVQVSSPPAAEVKPVSAPPAAAAKATRAKAGK